MQMSDADTLRAVADRLEITDLIYRYCRAVDRMDHKLGYSIWNENSQADYGENIFVGSGPGFIDYVCTAHLGTLTHSHQISNIIIALDGERASSESYVTATLRMAAGDGMKQMMVWSRYIDEWSRHDGRWGIDNRVAVIDFDEIRDVVPMNSTSRGRRDPSDPSYAVLPTT
jgi:hypothetical protein